MLVTDHATHAPRQAPVSLSLSDRQTMIRGLKVESPMKAATGFGGGHSYLSGTADWEGRKTPVFVFLKDEDEEKKVEAAVIDGPLFFDAERHDFVAGHGLSLWGAELK